MNKVIKIHSDHWAGHFYDSGVAICFWNGDLYVTDGHHPDIVEYLMDNGLVDWPGLYQAEVDNNMVFGWAKNGGKISWVSGNIPQMSNKHALDVQQQAEVMWQDIYPEIFGELRQNDNIFSENDENTQNTAHFNDFWPNYATFTPKSNIFDPIEDKLDQRVFDGETPENRVQNFIKRLYSKEFGREFSDLDPNKLIKLYLTGSLTTFQYSDTSDADVSVFPDYAAAEEAGIDPKELRQRLIKMSIDHLDGTFLPGGSHPLQFFVVPEGIKPEDLYQPGLRSAYDLQKREWIVPPERDRVHDVKQELPELYQRAASMADKMTQALDSDPETARAMWLQVHQKRQLDQRAGLGDFSEGNIVYKFLLHQGLFDRIRNELNEYIATNLN